ncbi:hypothetical protein [Mesorhizobium sp.]|uniref:hypothetical protein n=1 Tax=Mesorhizobium sp. TaxID=1871066 RepID=UPI0025C5109F|nr:hypothetical protein [Mesorhizobium sp.]
MLSFRFGDDALKPGLLHKVEDRRAGAWQNFTELDPTAGWDQRDFAAILEVGCAL